MTKTHALSALIAKRAELSGRLLDMDRQKARLRSELRSIDHALAIFGHAGDPNDIPAVRPKVYRFGRGELARFLLELRRDGLALGNRDAALKMIDRKGWDAESAELVAKVTEAVKGARKWMARSG